MQIVRELGVKLNDVPTALTIGVFDGVHRGHQQLIDHVVARARALQGQAAVLTFDPHPDLVLYPERERLYLTTLDERAALLAGIGVDVLLVVRFDRALMSLTAQAFMEQLCATVALRELYVGPGFALGRGREGTLDRLNELGQRLGYRAATLEPLLLGDEVVSSTRIRRLLREGRVTEVEPLLGRPYSLSGKVIDGDKRGRTIGFPTANIALDELHLLPADGVYVCHASCDDSSPQTYGAVVNIGVRPTFEGMQRRVEAHLLDFNGDLYGRVLRLSFLQWLRGEQRFSGVDALIAQIGRDVAAARAVLNSAAGSLPSARD
jgi:riboflavin kinase / FMN adenylyltransferase